MLFQPTIAIVIILILFLYAALKIVREYERLVVFRLGHLVGAKGPGIVILIPLIDKAERVSLRIITLDVPTQEVITKDNVTTSVNAVIYYRVVDPKNAIVNVERFYMATAQLAQTTLRSVAGQAELDELLSERDKLNSKIQQILDEATDAWGIKVTAVEIKDVVIPEALQKAISRQASAERERRAIVIQAEGEKQAAVKFTEAAGILNKAPGGYFIRLLRSIPEITSQAGNVLAFPLPIELQTLFGGLNTNLLKQVLADEKQEQLSQEEGEEDKVEEEGNEEGDQEG